MFEESSVAFRMEAVLDSGLSALSHPLSGETMFEGASDAFMRAEAVLDSGLSALGGLQRREKWALSALESSEKRVVSALKVSEEIALSSSAASIQAVWRGFLCRTGPYLREFSAREIQRHFRGHYTRNYLAAYLETQALSDAATRIQTLDSLC